MKQNYLLIILLACISQTIFSQTTTIPDANFEAYLEANGMGNGIANDNLVTTANIVNRTTLSIESLGISSLIGIEDFTSLITLRAGGNSLVNIDLSGLTNLDYVTLEDNILESLNISNNPSLGSLGANNNVLTSIDITGCVGLTELYLNDNMLMDLDLSLFTNLSGINVSNNQLTTLNIKNGTNTSKLNYSSAVSTTGNPDLECITVDNVAFSTTTWANIDTTSSFSEDCAATTTVPNAIFEDYLETHNADGNIVMIGDPTGMGNGIANDHTVKTPRIESVTTLNVSSLNIDDLRGIEGFAGLQTINVDNNNITELDLSNNSLLTSMSAIGNDLRILDMKNGNNGNVTAFFSTGNPNLSCINVDNASAGNLSSWFKDATTSFEVGCNETSVPDVNFENYLETHDTAGNTVSIGDLNSMGNGTAADGIVYTTRIENVTALSINNLSIIELTGIEDFTSLETLACSFNSISSIDLSNNLALTSFVALSNDLESLDLSANSNLIFLSVANNELTSLDIANGNNGNFTGFFATQNSNLTCINVDDESASYLNNTSIWAKDTAANYSIHCNETYIVDANFEAFLEANNMGNGIAADNYVTTANINSITSLDVSSQGISDLTGIEDFVALTFLRANGNSFTTIDVSNLTQLVNLWVHAGSLTELDVTANTLLVSLKVEGNELVEIDLTNNPELRILQINNNNLASIDVTTNLELFRIRTHYNPITELDLSNNILLTEIDVRSNQLTVLNIQNGNNGNITSFNSSNNPNLTCINVDDETASYLNLNTWIKDTEANYSIHCNETSIVDANFENYLETHDAAGTAVLLGNPTSMGNGIANDNYVTTANINTVTSLDVSSLSIVDLTGIEGFIALEYLNCNTNTIATLDVSNNMNLNALDASLNAPLTTLITTGLTALQTLTITDNSLLTGIDITTNTALVSLFANNNGLETLNITQNTNLATLNASNNGLEIVDTSQNTSLVTLNLSENELIELSLIQNSLLEIVDVSNNELVTLDLKNGANALMNTTGDMIATGNPNLSCINVDNATPTATYLLNWTIDPSTLFGEHCYETYIPDANFEAHLEANNMGNGIANDTYVLTSNISGVQTLYVNDLIIADLTGIEAFTALETLYCHKNDLTELDLSANTALKTLRCYNNQLTELDLSSNTNLEFLDVNTNNITILDVTLNTALKIINLDGNNLTVLNFDTCVALENVSVDNNNLNELNIVNGNNGSIMEFDASSNPNLLCINVDDPTQSYLDSWVLNIDDSTSFGEHCYETYIPDNNFENYLETHAADGTTVPVGDATSMGNGIANDDYVTTANINTVTSLNISGKSISNLIGIEDFTALESLDCNSNNIMSLTLNSNTALKTLICNINSLSELDLSANTSLEILNASTNGIAMLDVTVNTALKEVYLNDNSITALNLDPIILLEKFEILNNNLNSLSIVNGNNMAITVFKTTGNTDLECISVDDVAHSTDNWMDIDTGITSFSPRCFQTYVPDGHFEEYLETHDALGNVVALGNENSMGNGIDNDNYVYTAAINTVTSLDIHSLDISVLTGIEAFIALEYLNCNYNDIAVLDVSNNTNLNALYASLSPLTTLITTDLTALQTLAITDNSLLTSIDITSNTNLVSLHLKNNGLTALDVTQNTGLETLDFSNNAIETVDVTQNISLAILDASNNDLGTVDVTQNTSLEALDLSNTGLGTLDVTQNINLTYLNAANNDLEIVDVSQNTDLIVLNLSNNLLTGLSLTQNSSLEIVDVSNNELLTLDIKNGANGLMDNVGDMIANGNPNLSCINVDNASAAILAGWIKDASTSFGEYCYETSVPDTNFENYLETHNASGNAVPLGDATSMGNGIADDHYVTTANIETVTALTIPQLEIGSLTGIEGFTALESLVCFDNNLSTLDVSANTALNTLICYRNSLTDLDLGANTALTTLVCYFNELTILDVTANVNLEIIEAGNNQLTTLDVHLNTALKQIAIYDNNLTSLSVDACVVLERLDLENNNLIELRVVNGNNLGITDFDTTGNPNLICINVDNPTDSHLDSWLKDNTTSFGEHCNETYILDANFEDYLETHDADRNIVDIGDPTSMGNGVANDNYVSTTRIEVVTSLSISSQNISDLTGIEDFTALTNLNCSKNGLTMLDVSQNTLLTTLTFSDNQIGSIDITNNTLLTGLSFSDNQISNIDLSQNGVLEYVSAIENQLTSLDFSNNPLMEEIDCSENLLTSLILNQCTILEDLLCNDNQLQTLDLTTNTALSYFEANDNDLTSLDTSQNINLERISVENNLLTSLDLSQNINLEEVICRDNALTSLNVKNGNNTNIALFWINNNPSLTCVLVDDAMYSFAFTNRDFQTQYNEVTCGVQVSPKVMLQGAAIDPITGDENLMRDDLRTASLLPITSPYSDNAVCNPFVFDVTGDDAIVDWVWVELRASSDNTLVIDGQSALLQRDGDVVSADGVTAVGFNDVSAGNYYVVLKHRNHLGIMTNTTIGLVQTETTLDFTDADDEITYGSNAQTTFGMQTDILGMWTGNANEDALVQYLGGNSDAPIILATVLNAPGNFINFPTYIVNDYSANDVNMDGNTQYSGTNPDTPFILQNVLAHPGNFLNFSTYQITAQLPESINP